VQSADPLKLQDLSSLKIVVDTLWMLKETIRPDAHRIRPKLFRPVAATSERKTSVRLSGQTNLMYPTLQFFLKLFSVCDFLIHAFFSLAS
jgi:hypothetical protein